MTTEEPISQDNTTEDQAPGPGYPGPDEERASTAYGLPNIPDINSFTGLSKKGGLGNLGNIARLGRGAQAGVAAAQGATAAAGAAGSAASAAGATASAAGASAAVIGGGWIIIIIIIIIIVIVFLIVLLGSGSSSSTTLGLTQSGPIQAKIGDKLDYAITVNYPNTAQDIIIAEQIPDGTQYINAPQATYDPASNTVTWSIAAISGSASGSLISNVNTTLSLTLLATKDNIYIINIPKGKIINEVLGESDSQLSTFKSQLSTYNATPTVFQLVPTNLHTPTPPDNSAINNCIITKIGSPIISPSLPPECANF